MKSENYPLSRNEKIVIQELEKETLIYDLRNHKAFCLNQTSAMIWKACDGTKSVTEISQTLSRHLKSNVSKDLVWFALEQLKSENLLEDSSGFVTPLDNLSRREAVKRVGLASIIMLPVISALVAPTAIAAQSASSCFPADNSGSNSTPGCPCVGTFDCCGICSATGVCTGPSRPASLPADPGAAASCP
jgi:hypothetical protein